VTLPETLPYKARHGFLYIFAESSRLYLRNCSSTSKYAGGGKTHAPHVYLLYRSTSFLWWQAVAAIIGVTSSNPLRNNARCTWRHREGARYVYNTALRRAFSPLRPGGSVPADVHGCPRGVAPLRRPLAIRDTPVTHTGEETAQSPHHATGCAAHPSLLFRLLAMASPRSMLVGSH
jgi:hypothetical protein